MDYREEARQIYEAFMTAYLVERNIKKVLSFVTDDIIHIDITDNGMVGNKAQMEMRLAVELSHDIVPRQLVFQEVVTRDNSDQSIDLFTKLQITKVVAQDQTMTYTVRQTVNMRLEKGQHKISAIHDSIALKGFSQNLVSPLKSDEKDWDERHEEMLVQSVALLNDATAGGIIGCYFEPERPLYYVNEAMLGYLGFSRDELVEAMAGKFSNCIDREDRQRVDEVLQSRHGEGYEDYEIAYRMVKKNGDFVWIMERGKFIVNRDGRTIILGICFDISETVVLQNQLEENTKRLNYNLKELSYLTNYLPGGLQKCTSDEKYEFLYLSEGFIRYCGFSREEIAEKFNNQFINMVYEDDKERITKMISQYQGEGTIQLEYRMLTKDGRLVWLIDHASLVMDEDGKAYWYCVISDITEVKTLDNKLRNLTCNIPGGVCEVAINGHFELRYGNGAFYELYGYTPEALQQQYNNYLDDIIDQDDANDIHKLLYDRWSAGETQFEFEHRIYQEDGTKKWVLTRGVFIDNPQEIVTQCIVVDITARKKIEKELIISEQRLKRAVDEAKIVVFDYDMETKQVRHFNSAVELYGMSEYVDHVPESVVEDKIIFPDQAEEFFQMYERLRQGVEKTECIVKVRTVDNGYSWSKIMLTNIFDEGKVVKTIGIIKDISDQREAEINQKREEQYRIAMLAGAVAVCEANITCDVVLSWQENGPKQSILETISQYHQLITIIGERMIHPEDQEQFIEIFNRERILNGYNRGRAKCYFECRRLEPCGMIRWLAITMHLFKENTSGEVNALFYIKDINEKKTKEISLQYQAERDPLTGLYNRRTFEKLVQETIDNQMGRQRVHGMLIVDLDHFKLINDNLGHLFGDNVLSEVGNEMQGQVRASDITGRIGGDEFAIFLKDISSTEKARSIAETICSLLRFNYQEQDNEYHVSTSIGIAMFPTHGTDFEVLYQKADVALYYAKYLGRSRCSVYGDNLEQCIVDDLYDE